MCLVLLGTFVGGVFASNPPTQVLNVFVTNFPHTSHLGQPISNHVMLECGVYTAHALLCTRAFPDGTSTKNPSDPAGYVPAGSALVVTDVSWRSIANPGDSIILDILLVPPSGPLQVVFSSFATASADGVAANSEHMTTGFVVSPPATMLWNGPLSSVALMQGYLITAA